MSRPLLLLALLAASPSAAAQCLTSGLHRFLPTTGGGEPQFGNSVCIHADRVLIGAHLEDADGTDSGAAYVYRRVGGTWVGEANLAPPGRAAFDHFGTSVAMDAEWAVVGAPHVDGAFQDVGAVYVYRRTEPGGWAYFTQLAPPAAAAFDMFGGAVALSDGQVLVGAAGDNTLGGNAGTAHVFRYDEAVEDWVHDAQLLPPGLDSEDRFGEFVDLSGDRAIVGALGDDERAPNAGAAYLFRRDEEGAWLADGFLLAPDGEAGDAFGRVGVEGDYAVVSAMLDDDSGENAGAVWVFKRIALPDESGFWYPEDKLTPHQVSAVDYFGVSVDIAADFIAVGAFLDDDAAPDAGAAYVFRRSEAGWEQVDKLHPSPASNGAKFGMDVSLHLPDLVVSRIGDSESGTNAGSATIFELIGSAPMRYCGSALPNSSGSTGRLEVEGTTSILNNDLTFWARYLPANQSGLIIYSPDDGELPLGDGTLCLGTQTLGFILRLDPVASSAGGVLTYHFDNTSPPSPLGLVSAGSTWHFQCWHRDVPAGGAGFNFTDALRISFCP